MPIDTHTLRGFLKNLIYFKLTTFHEFLFFTTVSSLRSLFNHGTVLHNASPEEFLVVLKKAIIDRQ